MNKLTLIALFFSMSILSQKYETHSYKTLFEEDNHQNLDQYKLLSNRSIAHDSSG